MWITERDLEQKIDEALKSDANIALLESKAKKLRDEIADLEHKKTYEQREADQLIKIKSEKLEMEFRKKEYAINESHTKDVASKREAWLNEKVQMQRDYRAEILSLTLAILGRLPDFSVEVKKGR